MMRFQSIESTHEALVSHPRDDAAGLAVDTLDLAELSISAVVVLAGSVRANRLRKATGRSPLEMPVALNTSVMDVWRNELVAVSEGLRGSRDRGTTGPLQVRVMVDQGVNLETESDVDGATRIRVERDPSAYRGTGGLLHDVARDYPDHSRLLVVHGSQLPFRPLATVLAEQVHPEADVTVVTMEDGTPSGIMTVRCGALRNISTVGFVDLNEQALPRMAKVSDVRVSRSPHVVTRSIRTLSGYLDTLKVYNRRASGRIMNHDPFAEDWQASFQLIEGGSSIHETAIIHDSVVLAGARVDAGAVVVRSVICPGSVVGRGQSVVDRVFAAQD